MFISFFMHVLYLRYMINAVSDLAKRTIQFEMCTIVCGAHYDPKWKEKDEEDEKKK